MVVCYDAPCCSVAQSCLTLFHNELQHTRLPHPSSSSGACSNSCPLSQWCHPTISSSFVPFSSGNLSQPQGLFQWVSSLHQVSKVLELQQQSFQWIFRVDFFRIDWFYLLVVQRTLRSLLQHHNSNASPSLVLSPLYGPTLTSIHDYWKNHSFD